MAPRIAIPMPHASDPEYAGRAMPQYERAVELAGGDPVRILLDQTNDAVLRAVESCDAVLLPGSKADIDPSRFHATRSPHTAAADPRRDEVDELLLESAYKLRKPVLGICYGLQSLNVHRGGSLVQHIPDFLPPEARNKVNHEAGRKVPVAHTVEVEPDCTLAEVLRGDGRIRPSLPAKPGKGNNEDRDEDRGGHGLSRAAVGQLEDRASAPEDGALVVPVNSSHHQSADAIGKGLRVVARCTEDGIIEAMEGTSRDHFVLAVQWHPERSIDEDEASRRIFRALIDAARR